VLDEWWQMHLAHRALVMAGRSCPLKRHERHELLNHDLRKFIIITIITESSP